MRIAVLLTFLVLAGPLAGCFGDDEIIEETVPESYYPDIFERQNLDWNWTVRMRWFSKKDHIQR